MTRVLSALLALALVLSLAGCGGGFRPLGFLQRDRAGSAVPPPPSVVEDEAEETAEDGATPEAPVTEVAPTATGTLGTTIATLGDPARPGLWLETPLVTVEAPGQIETEGGDSLDVTLIPSGGLPGSGSRISLAAMQALGLGLTDLVTLTVSTGG
jgi:predicted small lipoprotein YifL